MPILEPGKHVDNLIESDIDLLLLEEFAVSGDFLTWFCSQAGVQDAVLERARRNVTDADGESDIVLWVRAGGQRMVVLIENKIDAPEQESQDERYHVRGRRLAETGGADRYVTVICAPGRYLDGLPSGSAYQHQVSYEDIAGWFDAAGSRRAAWRRDVFHQASDPANRRHAMQVNEETTAFQREYWEHLRQHHPRLQMNEPGNKGPGSNWIYMKGRKLPKGVGLRHKMNEHVMALCFEKRDVEELMNAQTGWPEDIRLDQRGQEAVLSIRVPPVDPHQEFEPQRDAVEAALEVAYRLQRYGRILEEASPGS